MLKSPPPPSPIAKSRPSNGAPAAAALPAKKGKPLRTRIAAAARWLHIYVSMIGLLAILFFSATGVTLNHPDWFFADAQALSHEDGEMNPEWLTLDADAGADAVASDDQRVSRLEVVEFLRERHGVRGALSDFVIDEFECEVMFKGPGYSADAFIDRETGAYTLTESYAGFVAVMNDLHKGHETGPVWSLFIDAIAVLLIVVSLTGLILLLYLKKRRRAGLVTVLAGAVFLVAVYLAFVP